MQESIQERDPSPVAAVDVVEEMLDARDIAKMFRVSLPRAYGMLAGGDLPVVRVGRSVRVPRRRLEAWIDRQVAAGTSERGAA